ncbi:MAG: DUF3784 domain-containing protein [Lachnospiraceae bacterium]|nr:DUF3784 domain-containing protein [Lachnospiraceae bacterium]MBR4412066.1 DUF3784 domain-containing protein [Lachnospiraceae bacterium]MBR5067618.1 DUF3784 domain-containing protein [Lachnospiraceae bacterium]MBR5917727.1 DUF3784 domain-containing protein [Lachnospiraceae bacterium]
MSDLTWLIIIGALFMLLGMVFIVLGIMIGIRQKMNLIISYHCDKVSEENKKAYCNSFGLGMFFIGIGFAITGILSVILQSLFALIPMAVGLVLGIAFLLGAIIKYNR